MTSTIKLTGIKAVGRHGANRGEQDEAQTFYIDLELLVGFNADEIDQTQNYDDVVSGVKKVVEQKNFQLIETMAAYLAKKIMQLERVHKVKIVVHKPSAAKYLLVQDVSAEVILEDREQD